ncbi:CWF19-like protein 2 isoform X3 [Coregonus clupeaformis]|uniref:CWF19-like protein 2 isoform X2 n=1 Tax=Coregonus clupeaformis TaxID=59861 RepID=UPI001E1C94D5|nr:CWF19-like protein 2 isoform X2 [Coregonus clupeaformis]XP_045070455.1 CWF19-like protein 2 isoform X3 [Coregonus clupeaformis]
MAAYGSSFESVNSIEDRKEYKRKAREEVIQKAKQQYEKEEKRKELKRQRGEDTWMLPEVDLRLQQLEQEVSSKTKKKKEKKTKKSKKEKKKKKEKRAQRGDGSSASSEGSEDEWVEAQPQAEASGKAWKIPAKSEAKPTDSSPTPAENNQRDEWMTFDFLTMRTTSTAEKRAEKERLKAEEKDKARVIEQAGLHKLELNPFWKDGGSGLPPEEKASNVVKKAAIVDDGGLGWLRKSYQRMREQAEREQRSLEVIVAERYGSMEKFQKRMDEAEIAVYGYRRGEGRDGERWRGGEEAGMGRERWRKGEEGMDRERWRRPDKGRDSLPGEKERDRDGGRHSDRDRERDGGRPSDRNRERDGGRPSDRDRERDGGRPSDRDGGRARDTDRDREGDRPRDRGADESLGSGLGRSLPPLSLGALKSRFLKPADDDDGDGVSAPAPARTSMGFLKPVSDDEESDRKSSGPAWRKSSSGQKSASGKPEQDKERESGITMSSPDQGHSSNRPAVTSSRSESSSDSSSEEEEEVPILTDEEMNKLGARLVKAEIMGNTALMEKLKTQLESARKAKENRAAQQPGKSDRPPGQTEEDQEVLLFRTDQSGRAWPVNASSEPQEPRGGRRKKKAIETHRDGERVRYFQDDDSVGLHEMVRREKMSSAEDQNSLYARMAGKMMGKTDDDNYTLDDMFVSSAAQREGEGRDEDRMRSRAIAEHRRLAVTMEKCHHCFSNPELQKHLLIAIGTKVYLSLPGGVSLTEGHCLITPLQHHCSATGLDEDVWTEIQVFRRALVQMFESQDQDCVFMETHMNPKRRQHMVLECLPLPRELGDMAPIYFKKAIMECDEEWAMNKKVVDLSSKDIRHAVPRGLPYFSVDFGLQGGFAHVIENEHKFPHYFGKEIVGGMLDVEPRIWRKSIRENFDNQRKKVLEFSQWWKPFDCTKTDS